MSKGVVMEVQKRKVILLTPDGQFVTCKKQDAVYEVGTEINYTRQDTAARTLTFPRYLKPIAMIAACLLLFVLFYKPDSPVMAYVSIDINPSLEASVTQDLHVKDLKPYNKDGERILKELKDWKGKPLQDVLQEIIVLSEKDGYLTSGKQILLASVLKTQNDISINKDLEKLVKSFQDKYKKDNITVELEKASLKDRDEANKEGISTGTYLRNKENQNSSQPVQPSVEPSPDHNSTNIPDKVPDVPSTPNHAIDASGQPDTSSNDYSNEGHSAGSNKQQPSGYENNHSTQNVDNKNDNSINNKHVEQQKNDKNNNAGNGNNEDKNKLNNNDSHQNSKGKKEHD